MPNKFDFGGDEIDITNVEPRQPDTGNELPDEIVVEDIIPSTDENNQPPVDEGQPSVIIPAEEAIVTPVVTEQTLNDELVFDYLSKLQGREIKNFEDLVVKETAPNPLDADPYMKELYEWRQKTGRTVEEYFEFQKDWDQENDLVVARKLLQTRYPDFDESEIDFEMRKITPTEDDYDDDLIAKKIELKKLATEGRAEFKKLQADLGNPTEVRYSPEVQYDLDLAKAVKEDYEVNQQRLVEYGQSITKASLELQTIPLRITDDLTINYSVSEDIRKSLPELMASMPAWHNEDGSWNHAKVVEDGIKATHFDEILKLATEQAFNAGLEAALKQGNNSTPPSSTPSSSQNINKPNEIQVEGEEDLFNQRGTKMKFGFRGK